MGWLNGSSNIDPSSGDQTSDTQSSHSDHEGEAIEGSSKSSHLHLDPRISAMEVELHQSQSKVEAVERRIRERDAQVKSLNEEKAEQIADLKNQMYQLQFEVEETTCDKAEAAQEYQAQLAASQRELLEATRAFDAALRSQADAAERASVLERENNGLKNQLQAENSDRDAETAKLRCQLSEAQSANAALSGQIAEEKAGNAMNRQLGTKEVSSLRSMLRARDDAIRSLQSRVETGQGEVTALEAELDNLRGEMQKFEREKGKEKENAARLRKENLDMGQLMDKQNQTLKDMTTKLDRQRKECEEQRKLAQRRGEEIDLLKSALEEEGLEKEANLDRSNSLNEQNRSRVTTLEVELQTINERADELTSALNEAMEEIEDLHADTVFKEGKIASLEEEMEDAIVLLKAREPLLTSPTSMKASDNYARLRSEIEGILRERAQYETDHASQLLDLKTTRDSNVSRLEHELGEVQSQLSMELERAEQMKADLEEVEKARTDLSHRLEEEKAKNDKLQEVMDQLDAEEDRELEEMKEQVNEQQLTNDKLQSEVQGLQLELKDAKRELAMMNNEEAELSKVRQELLALNDERGRSSTGAEIENAKEEVRVLREKLAECDGKIRSSDAKLKQIVTEKDMIISDLRSELSSKDRFSNDLKDELLQLSVERSPPKRNHGVAIDPEWHEPDTVSKLKMQVSTLSKEKRMVEGDLRSKINARDATIATLVLSNSNLEANIASLKSDVNRLHGLAEDTSAPKIQSFAFDTKGAKEIEYLRERVHDLTIELKQTKRRLQSVTEELDSTKSQLIEAGRGTAVPETQDLAGRLVISEQSLTILKAESNEKLRERDSAISNLLQSVQTNEGIIANLRADVATLQSKLNESLRENGRVQHESEMLATQITHQDREFESLHESLKEKTAEISSLKRELASSSKEIRNIKNLERELDQLKEHKRHNMAHVNELEMELRDVKLRKAEEDGFELERLKLELKRAEQRKDESEEQLNKQIDSLRKLRNHAMEDFEAKLHERDSQIALLESELAELKENALEEKHLMEERDMLRVKIEALGEEIKTLKASKGLDQISELRKRLAQSETLREELEKDRADSGTIKDTELDRLRKLLSEAKEAQSAREVEQEGLVKKLEAENDSIREEFSLRVKEKNAKIVALEQTLAAQEQVVGNMSSEMDQLQNGMEKISVQRRAEIEEMQQELVDYTSTATKLEREVTALSLKLDDKRLKHKAEVAKLKERIATLESEAPLEHNLFRDDRRQSRRREQDLKEKNDHLKWLNSSLKDENEKLKKKVQQQKTKIDPKRGYSQASHYKSHTKSNDKSRNVALQEQVAVLSQRVIELEESAATVEQSSQRPSSSPPPRPSILHSPGMRMSLENDTANNRSSSELKLASAPSAYGNADGDNIDPLTNELDNGILLSVSSR
ncbi:hypothetical protein ACHAWF_011331, partial [Thalassiosira exigua]